MTQLKLKQFIIDIQYSIFIILNSYFIIRDSIKARTFKIDLKLKT